MIWESHLCWLDWEYQIEKDQTCVSPRPVWGKMGEGAVWFSVCGVPLDDWANGGYVDVLFTCGECHLSSFGSWSCWGVGMGLIDKNYVLLFQVSQMSAGWHSRNLILAIYYHGLMVSTAGHNHKGPNLFPRRAECAQAYNFWYCELLL